MASVLLLCLLFLRLDSSGAEGNQASAQNLPITSALVGLDVSNVSEQRHVRVLKVQGYKGTVVYKFFAKDGYKFQPITYKDKPLQPYSFAYADYVEFLVAEDIRIVLLRCVGGFIVPKIYVYDVTYISVKNIPDDSVYFQTLASHMNNVKAVVETRHPKAGEHITEDYIEEFFDADKNNLVSLVEYGTTLVWTFDVANGEQLYDYKVYHPRQLTDPTYFTLRLENIQGEIVHRNFKITSQGAVSAISSDAEKVIKGDGKSIHDTSGIKYYREQVKTEIKTIPLNIANVPLGDAFKRANAAHHTPEIRIAIEAPAGHIFTRVEMDKDLRVDVSIGVVFIHRTSDWGLLHFGTSVSSPPQDRHYFLASLPGWKKISLREFKIYRKPHLRVINIELLEYSEGIEYRSENMNTSEIGMYAYDDYFIQYIGSDGAALWSYSEEVFFCVRVKLNNPGALATVYVLGEDSIRDRNQTVVTSKGFDALKDTIFGEESVEKSDLVEEYESPPPLKDYNQATVVKLDLKSLEGDETVDVDCFDEVGGTRHCTLEAKHGYKLRPLTFGDYTLWGEINCFAERVETIYTHLLSVVRVFYRDENGVKQWAYYKFYSKGSHKIDFGEYFKIVAVHRALGVKPFWPAYSRVAAVEVNEDYDVEFYAAKKQVLREIKYKRIQICTFDVANGEQLYDCKVYHPKQLTDPTYLTLRLKNAREEIVHLNFKVTSQDEVSAISSGAEKVIKGDGKSIRDSSGVPYYQDEFEQEPTSVKFNAAQVDIDDEFHGVLASRSDEEMHIIVEPYEWNVFKGVEIGRDLHFDVSPKRVFLHLSKRWQLLHFGTSESSNLANRHYFIKKRDTWQKISLTEFKIYRKPYLKVINIDLVDYNKGVEYIRNKGDGVDSIEIYERFGYFFEIVYIFSELQRLFSRGMDTAFDYIKIENKSGGAVATLIYLNKEGASVEEELPFSSDEVYKINQAAITQGNDPFCNVEATLLQKSVLVHLDISKPQGNEGALVEVLKGANGVAIYRFVPRDGYRFLPVTYRDVPLQPHEQIFTVFVEALVLEDLRYVRIVGKNSANHLVSSLYYIDDNKRKQVVDGTEYFQALEAIAENQSLVFGPRYPVDDVNITDDYFVEYVAVGKNKLANRVLYGTRLVWEFDVANGQRLYDCKVYHPMFVSDFAYFTLRLKNAQEETVHLNFKLTSQGAVSSISSGVEKMMADDGKSIHDTSGVAYFQDQFEPTTPTEVGFNVTSVDIKDALNHVLESATTSSNTGVEVRMVIEPPPGYYFDVVYHGLLTYVEDKITCAFLHVSLEWQLWDFTSVNSPKGGRHYFKKWERGWQKMSLSDFKNLRFPFLTSLQIDVLKENIGIEVIEVEEKAHETRLKEYFGYAVTEVKKGDETLWTSNESSFEGMAFRRDGNVARSILSVDKSGTRQYLHYDITLDEYTALLGVLHPPPVSRVKLSKDKQVALQEKQEAYKRGLIQEEVLRKRRAMDVHRRQVYESRKRANDPGNLDTSGNKPSHLSGFSTESFVLGILAIFVLVC